MALSHALLFGLSRQFFCKNYPIFSFEGSRFFSLKTNYSDFVLNDLFLWSASWRYIVANRSLQAALLGR